MMLSFRLQDKEQAHFSLIKLPASAMNPMLKPKVMHVSCFPSSPFMCIVSVYDPCNTSKQQSQDRLHIVNDEKIDDGMNILKNDR